MNRTTSIALAAVLLVAVTVPLAAGSGVSSDVVHVQDGPETGSDGDGGTDSTAPGERFAATVGVQNAELDGNVSERAFERALTNAESDEAKAAVIGDRFDASHTRLDALENRLEELNESREADEISEGRYRGEVATVVVEMRSIERQATAAETAAGGLPADVLSEQGVTVDAIKDLRERAQNRGGPETAAIARSIAGNDAGNSASDDGPGNPASDDGSGNSANENGPENSSSENHTGGERIDEDSAERNETATPPR